MPVIGEQMRRLRKARVVSGCAPFILGLALFTPGASAQALAQVCHPTVTGPVVLETHEQIIAGGLRAVPPITDTGGFGFAWPDTQMGVIKTPSGYEFFGSDGGLHPVHDWDGHSVGNGKYGGVVTTMGTLDNPLGSGDPVDVSISPNPDPAVNPNYPSYGYMGGGPVYQVPAGMIGAGNLLLTYHAELTNYALLGLAASSDNGLHWTDLGEIIRLNQAYMPGLTFSEIGDDPLVLSPDGKYFYIYFPDLPATTTTTTHASVARASVASLLDAAFGSSHPHAVPFEKFYETSWHLQPGIGGASTDLLASSLQQYSGYLDVHYNSALQRYVMITSDDTNFAYYESVDGLHWTDAQFLGVFGDPGNGTGSIAPYPYSVGLGDDPRILGKTFYVYYLHLQLENGGLPRKADSLRRLTLTCP
jgi:hypothetical protein